MIRGSLQRAMDMQMHPWSDAAKSEKRAGFSGNLVLLQISGLFNFKSLFFFEEILPAFVLLAGRLSGWQAWGSLHLGFLAHAPDS